MISSGAECACRKVAGILEFSAHHASSWGFTNGGSEGVETAYRDGFHLSLHPDLSDERVELFARQKEFLLVHGFLAADFELESWIERGPIEAAAEIVASEGVRRDG